MDDRIESGGDCGAKPSAPPSRHEAVSRMEDLEAGILSELRSLPEVEMLERIAHCKRQSENFTSKLVEMEPKERAAYMMAVGEDVKKELIIARIWKD